jgi:hypothetical protein
MRGLTLLFATRGAVSALVQRRAFQFRNPMPRLEYSRSPWHTQVRPS